MAITRKIKVFSAGCAVCEDTIALINKIACPSCEVQVLDMHKPEIAKKARQFGIRSVPAVIVDGKLADCCAGRGPDEGQLRAAGIGTPL
jgi:glutaredoxin